MILTYPNGSAIEARLENLHVLVHVPTAHLMVDVPMASPEVE